MLMFALINVTSRAWLKGACPKKKANRNTTTHSDRQNTTVVSISIRVRGHKAEARIWWCASLCGRSYTNKQQVTLGAATGSKIGFKGAKGQEYDGPCSSCRQSVLRNLRSEGGDCSLRACQGVSNRSAQQNSTKHSELQISHHVIKSKVTL